MNYLRHYNLLVERARSRLTHKDDKRHHIMPDCLFINRKRKGPAGFLEGDPDSPENITFLTCREHYLAHLLLVKIYPANRSLVYAARMMTFNSPDHKDGRSKNRMYAWLKKKYILARTGTKHSEETKTKMSNSALGKPKSETAKKNMRKPKQNYISKKGIPTGRKTKGSTGMTPWNKGKEHMIGEKNPAFGKIWDDEKRNKMSGTNKGRKRVYRDDGSFYYIYPHLYNKAIL